MNLLLPGLYVAADSPVHRLDPRVKMGAAMVLMVLPFAAPQLASSLLLVLFLAVLARLSAAPLKALLHTLRTVLWLGLFLFIFYFFTTPGRPLVSLWGISVTLEGVLLGATQIYRLCFLVLVASLLTYTTSPAQLTHGLEAVFRPFARVGVPVREFTMVLSIALRFVPTLFDQIDRIMMAQRARGADVRSGAPWQRVKCWVPVFVPIFVAAFRRAEELATAMDARGFRGVRRRTHLRKLDLGWRDLAAAAAVLCVGALALLSKRI